MPIVNTKSTFHIKKMSRKKKGGKVGKIHMQFNTFYGLNQQLPHP
jgi:hypothetical protein